MIPVSVDVRWATTGDAEALATMLCEMAAHYRQAPLDHGRATATARTWLGDESPAYPHFALAFAGGAVAGLASVATAHPGIDLERLMFLKDLFVREDGRSAGIARVQMIAAVVHRPRKDRGAVVVEVRDGVRVRAARRARRAADPGVSFSGSRGRRVGRVIKVEQ